MKGEKSPTHGIWEIPTLWFERERILCLILFSLILTPLFLALIGTMFSIHAIYVAIL